MMCRLLLPTTVAGSAGAAFPNANPCLPPSYMPTYLLVCLSALHCCAVPRPLQVVERMVAQGGDEALLELCRRFRQSFVEALQPAFLPPGWHVFHFSKRQFGVNSVYYSGGEEGEGDEGS